MKKEVKWNIDIQIHDIILKNIERYWNIKFPAQYVDAVKNHDGAKIKVKADNGKWKEKYSSETLSCEENQTPFYNSLINE